MLPWDALRDAEERLTEAERSGDPLSLASARSGVEAERTACAALFAELLLHAAGTDGVRQAVGRVIDGLEPADGMARNWCHDLTNTAEWLVSRVTALRHENWELSKALIRLESRIDQLEAERVEQQAAHHPGPGAGVPQRVERPSRAAV